jgi:hypothetical protein
MPLGIKRKPPAKRPRADRIVIAKLLFMLLYLDTGGCAVFSCEKSTPDHRLKFSFGLKRENEMGLFSKDNEKKTEASGSKGKPNQGYGKGSAATNSSKYVARTVAQVR